MSPKWLISRNNLTLWQTAAGSADMVGRRMRGSATLNVRRRGEEVGAATHVARVDVIEEDDTGRNVDNTVIRGDPSRPL